MYAFKWTLTTFRSESYIGSATALPDTALTPGAVVGDGVATATEVGTGSCMEDVATAVGVDGTADWVLVSIGS